MTVLCAEANDLAGASLRFLRHGKSILPLNLPRTCGKGTSRLLSPFIGRMSFGRLFLGRLLASRACIRFAVHLNPVAHDSSMSSEEFNTACVKQSREGKTISVLERFHWPVLK